MSPRRKPFQGQQDSSHGLAENEVTLKTVREVVKTRSRPGLMATVGMLVQELAIDPLRSLEVAGFFIGASEPPSGFR